MALSYLHSAHDAQDLTQDVFVRVWDCAAQYRPTGSPVGWLLAVCRNLCLMKLCSKSHHTPLTNALKKPEPDGADGVLSRCKEKKGTVIAMTTKKAWTALTATCLALVLMGSSFFYQQAHAAASVVSLDVAPSIELRVNKNEKVLSCPPLNDGQPSGYDPAKSSTAQDRRFHRRGVRVQA